MLDGDRLVEETVTCRSSPEAIVKNIGRNGSVTVQLMSFGSEKKYWSFPLGKI